jgi:hypothetical protein
VKYTHGSEHQRRHSDYHNASAGKRDKLARYNSPEYPAEEKDHAIDQIGTHFDLWHLHYRHFAAPSNSTRVRAVAVGSSPMTRRADS